MFLLSGCLATFREPEYPTERVSEQGRAEPLVINTNVDREEHIGRHWRSICQSEATSVVRGHIESGIDHDVENVSVGRSTSGGIFVHLVWTLSRDGTLIGEPNVDFEDVIEVTPESVTVTLTIDGEANECQYDVFVEKVTEQLE